MADREQPYDPYIPSGQAAPGGSTAQHGGNQRTAALQAVGLVHFSYIMERGNRCLGCSRNMAVTFELIQSFLSLSCRFLDTPVEFWNDRIPSRQ